MLISVCPMVQEIVGHPRSLYFTEIGPDRISLICCQEYFLGHIRLSLLRTHILKKFGIGWDLLDSVKKRHIQFDLIKHLKHLSMYIFLLLFLSLFGKGATGL